jgi:carboxypeptidase Taq
MTEEPKLAELKTRLGEIDDLRSAASVLNWDQSTYMPPGGAAARGRQLATLSRLAHEKFTDTTIGNLLDDLRPYEKSLPADSDDASLIRITRRDYERSIRVPASHVAEARRHGSASFQAWTQARPADDFAAMQPYLERTLELSREFASFFPGYEHIADPFIELTDEGLRASSVRELFARLRASLVPLVDAITSQPPADDSCLSQPFPESQQLAFGERVIRAFGYDYNRGRQDKTHHPFETRFSIGDVRITTRVDPNRLNDALFATMHESGHGMYEQGVNPEYERTPLARGASPGVHESQSRLWENLVGRSRGFWIAFYPQIQQAFPAQLGNVSLDAFYRAINKVERSLIRVEADEVTYNLHVMLRFDLELDLLDGTLAVRDLADAWRERYQRDVGVAPPDSRDGVLQDVHWYAGRIGGGFQGYTIGNILGAQFYAAAMRDQPEIPSEVQRGEFERLHRWLRERIYYHGRKYTAPELVERVTGGPISIDPYIAYLRNKFGELYQL